MKGNQTGGAVIVREVVAVVGEQDGAVARRVMSAKAFLKIKKTKRVPLPETKINMVSQFSLTHKLRCGAVAKCSVNVINARWPQMYLLYCKHCRTLDAA